MNRSDLEHIARAAGDTQTGAVPAATGGGAWGSR